MGSISCREVKVIMVLIFEFVNKEYNDMLLMYAHWVLDKNHVKRFD